MRARDAQRSEKTILSLALSNSAVSEWIFLKILRNNFEGL